MPKGEKMEKKKRVLNSTMGKISNVTKDLSGKASNAAKSTVHKVGDVATQVSNVATQKINEVDFSKYQFDAEDVLKQLMKIPAIKVDRHQFLRKELMPYFPEKTVYEAIDKNPAYVGIAREKIDEIANQVINYETNKVSAVSFAAGMPGGLTMIATVPADVLQYFGNVVIVIQKLSYLYGFADFELNDSEISDNTLNELMIFLGVMFGVQGANTGVKIIAEAASKKVMRSLPQKALTKTTIYPIVKKVATALGMKVTKEVFAKGVSTIVPVIGGVISGGITYATFKPGCRKLQKTLKGLRLSDPTFYKDTIDVEV